jgi:DUF177 domain-containing protein
MDEFRLPVARLLRSHGSSEPVSLATALEGLSTPLGGVKSGSVVRVEGRLDSLSDGIWFEGSITGRYTLECARCLAPLDAAFGLSAAELFAVGLEEGSDEGYPLVGDVIDLLPLVRDTVLLGIPSHPLCRLDCAGLCARCGAELNAGPCGCPPPAAHPALVALRDLFPGPVSFETRQEAEWGPQPALQPARPRPATGAASPPYP